MDFPAHLIKAYIAGLAAFIAGGTIVAILAIFCAAAPVAAVLVIAALAGVYPEDIVIALCALLVASLVVFRVCYETKEALMARGRNRRRSASDYWKYNRIKGRAPWWQRLFGLSRG